MWTWFSGMISSFRSLLKQSGFLRQWRSADYCLWVCQSAILPLSSCDLLLNFSQICQIGRHHKDPQDAWSGGHVEPVGPLGWGSRGTCVHSLPHALSLARPTGKGGDGGELRAACWELRQHWRTERNRGVVVEGIRGWGRWWYWEYTSEVNKALLFSHA